MPKKKVSKFDVVLDRKGNLWVKGDNMKYLQEWIRKGAGIVEVLDESTRKKRRSRK